MTNTQKHIFIRSKRSGFTLIELMVTVLIAGLVFVAVGMVLADSIRGYDKMTTRIHGDIVNDAYVARLMFDKVCRKGRNGSAVIDVDVPSLRVKYYAMPNVLGDADLDPDMYAQFYFNNVTNTLDLDTGFFTLVVPEDPEDPSYEVFTSTTTQTVARNVTEVKFSTVHSKSVQMVLTLDDSAVSTNSHSITITCGSIMHN